MTSAALRKLPAQRVKKLSDTDSEKIFKENKMKKLLFCAMIGMLFTFAVAAGGGQQSGSAAPAQAAPAQAAPAQAAPAPAKTFEISFPTHFNSGTTEFDAVERFQKAVESGSNGRIKIKTFPGSSLGSEMENLEQVKTNLVQMSVFGDLLTSQLTPELDPTCVPFIFPNIEEVYAYWNGPMGAKIQSALESRGNQLLVGLQKRGARELTASKMVKTPADLKGIKLRVPEIPSWVAVWKGLGALPTPVAWAETYNALQTRVVDAQENPISNIYVAKIYEVYKYTIMTDHLYNVYHWTVNKDFLNSLPADLKKLLLDSAKEACAWGDTQVDSTEKQQIEQLKKAGVTFVDVDKQVFINAARPFVEQLAEKWDPAARDAIKKYYK